MICRLYELLIETEIDIGADQDCNNLCPDYVEDKKYTCSICSNDEVRLCKKTKYGWSKVRTIEFTNADILKDEETAYQIIKLIHPSYSSIWIVRWLTKKQDDNINDEYTIHINYKETRVEDLDKLNWLLSYKCHYDGRYITLKDFELRRKDE